VKFLILWPSTPRSFENKIVVIEKNWKKRIKNYNRGLYILQRKWMITNHDMLDAYLKLNTKQFQLIDQVRFFR
jgi:hypothetical protein